MTNIDSKKGLTPPTIQDVKVTGGFWAHAQDTNANTTLPIEYEQCKQTGRIDAFRLDWTPDSNRPKPHYFWDSDVAKWIEGAAYSLSHHPDPKLQSQVDAIFVRCAVECMDSENPGECSHPVRMHKRIRVKKKMQILVHGFNGR